MLFLSNGAGEDSIARQIISQVQGLSCEALPLVSTGAGYGGVVPLLGPRRALPSGGLVPQDYKRVGSDIQGGMLKLWREQYACLRRERRRFAAVVAVGDLYAVAWAWLSNIRPILFVGTAKSAYHHDYSALEAGVLRWLGVRSLVRDERTAQSLRRRGVRAEWIGNAIMDGLQLHDVDLSISSNEAGLAMFPGSREGTYRALAPMLQAYELLYQRIKDTSEPVPRALVVLAPSVDMQRLGECCPGYALQSVASGSVGVVGKLFLKSGDDDHPVLLCRGCMADVLKVSRVALGLAGTAHEQAAGYGLPVVAFDAPEKVGAPLGWYRGRQQGLLGEALQVVVPNPEIIAATLAELWGNAEERQRRGAIGRERMGAPGASIRMAQVIAELVAGGSNGRALR